jgi:ABC-type multidrug transport system ATPase subunit
MALIAANGLGRRFGANWVFRNIELEVARGEVLCVVGSNGSGKSTLLRILAGLLSPSVGSVARPALLGYSALDLALWPQLSAREHLALAARLRGVDGRVEQLLERVGLEENGDKPVAQFSTGMRARLKFALATQHDPDVLLLDEPSASLDQNGRDLVVRTVEAQQERGCVVLATNDPADRRLATHELELG